MTVTVKLITEQTTNQLVDSVNKAQASNWYPVCGVVYFNARYTQLMAQDTDITTPPACGYFIVDSEDGIDFANRVNKLVALNSGAVCLSSVQYVNARYIQAWGDDSLHNGGGGSGGDALKWYTENATKTGPIIDTDTNLPEIGLGNEWAGYLMLKFITGGNSAGYLHADDGTLTLARPNGTYFSMTDANYNLLVDNVSVLNSDSRYTNLIAQGSALTLAPGFAGITSPAGALELDETRGIKLYGNGGVNSVIDADPTQATFGDNAATTNVKGSSLVLDANGKGTLEMDDDATRFKRGTNNLLSLSDSGGAMTWNSYARCIWDANGWNVSRDNGVAFSSRATYSMMQAQGGARFEANDATGATIVSGSNSALASSINVTNTGINSIKGGTSSTLDANGFTLDTHGEYHYRLDGAYVLFSSGDITSLGANGMSLNMDDGAGISLNSHSGFPIHLGGGPVLPSGVESLGAPEQPWGEMYLVGQTPNIVQQSTGWNDVPTSVSDKMVNLLPKALDTINGKATGYVYDDIIANFGAADAQLYGLAWLGPNGEKIVNPMSCLAMEALYVRGRI